MNGSGEFSPVDVLDVDALAVDALAVDALAVDALADAGYSSQSFE